MEREIPKSEIQQLKSPSIKGLVIAGFITLGLGGLAWFFASIYDKKSGIENGFGALAFFLLGLVLIFSSIAIFFTAFISKIKSRLLKAVILFLLIVLFVVLYIWRDYFNAVLSSF